MDTGLIILGILFVVAFLVALQRDPALPGAGFASALQLVKQVAPELILGFLLAGFLDVLIPPGKLVAWLGGEQQLGRAVLLGWGVGLALPGGPYLLFPIAAKLYGQGVAAGAIIALITAKTLASPIRMITYEAPLLGWPLTLARLLPVLLLPPLVGFVGHGLHGLFRR